jgi:hypothetical protein
MDSSKTPLAVAVFTAVIYIVCAIAIWIAPGGMQYLAQSWFHGIELTFTDFSRSTAQFLTGLISSFILMYVGTWLFVKIHQGIAGK